MKNEKKDPQGNLFLEAADSFGDSFSMKESFSIAQNNRISREGWLIRARFRITLEIEGELPGSCWTCGKKKDSCGENPRNCQNYDFNEGKSWRLVQFFESEVARLNNEDIYWCPECDKQTFQSFCECGVDSIVITDDGINRWNTRSQVGDVEWGLPPETSVWDMEGPEVSYEDLNFPEDANLWHCEELLFESREEGNRAYKSLKESWRKGNHTQEILGTSISDDPISPFKIRVLKADPNWGHLVTEKYYREELLDSVLLSISECPNVQSLKKIEAKIKRLARDAIIRRGNPKTGEPPRVSRSIGLDYRRYARLVNAVADKAAELGYHRFPRKIINEIENPEFSKESDDVMDHHTMPIDSVSNLLLFEESISEVSEPWIPSKELSPPRLYTHKTWDDICRDRDAWRRGEIEGYSSLLAA